MRGYRRPRPADEEESAYVSMTDLTVGFLFIVILLMAFFATQFSAADTIPRDEYEELRAERDAALAERDAALAERDSLAAARAQAQAKIAELEAERDALDRARVALAERLAEVEREADGFRTAIATLRDRGVARAAEIAALETQLRAVRSDLAETEAARSGQALRLAASEAENRTLRAALARAEERIAELEDLFDEEERRNPLEAYLAGAYDARRAVLEGLRETLLARHPGILVEVSPEGDALRFQGEGLFASGQANLQARSRAVVEDLARFLDEAIACLSLAALETPRPGGCAADAIVEAVQIEGHTDTVGSAESNLRLSTGRANAAFVTMIAAAPDLERRLNLRGQPVMGVAGYGQMRLAVPTGDGVPEPANRRIDVRILMQTPATVDEIETIRRRLAEGR